MSLPVLKDCDLANLALPHNALLSNGWRVTYWSRPGNTPMSVQTNLETSEAIHLYDIAYAKGLRPTHWKHEKHGVAMFNAGKWDNSDFEASLSEYSPFIKYLRERIKALRPIVTKPEKTRAWPIGCSEEGKAGETKDILIQPSCLYKIESLMATDKNKGLDTEILSLSVNNREQPFPSGQTSDFLKPVKLPDTETMQAGHHIKLKVQFLKDSSFQGRFDGKAIISQSG